MSIFILLAMWFGAALAGRRLRRYTYATMLVLVTFGILTSLQGGRLADNQPTPWMGIEERVNIYATMHWIAALAIVLLRESATPIPEPGARTSGQSHSLRKARAPARIAAVSRWPQ